MDQYSSKPTINLINTPDQYPITIASAKPKHHVPESSATASFLGLVLCGLPVEIVSAVSEIGEIGESEISEIGGLR